MTEDMKEYKEAYLTEARTHVNDMNLSLIEWEKSPRDKKYLQEIFRIAHTLKSISAAMGYNHIAELCHAIEDLLEAVRDKKVRFKNAVEMFFITFDFLTESIKTVEEDKPEPSSSPLIDKIIEIISNKNIKNHNIATPSASLEKITSIEVKVERLDKLLNLTKELLVNKMRLDSLSESIQSTDLSANIDVMNRIVSELQYHVMQIRLVPIGFVFNRFTRMVRDLAKQQNKEIALKTEGHEIELDRSLIDGISEALAHLIRNAIDHGLESTEKRKSKHKPLVGTIKLSATREKEALVIEVSDDGAGLNLEAIKKIGIKENILAHTATNEEVLNSVFHGLSTSKTVTKVSGRGLGLSIVRQKIESINGSLQVKTQEGEGARFIVRIPLTLAVIFVLLIRQGNHTYAIPMNSIERLITVEDEKIKGLINDEAIIYNHRSVPLLNLAKIFLIPLSAQTNRKSIVILRKDNELLGLMVDTLLTTEEIITQPINTMIKASKLFSGSALLGSGEMILILDPEQLFLSTVGFNKSVEL